MKKYQLTISLFLAILFHVSGLIGMLFTDYADWFINLTPLNLLLMFLLLIWNQPKPGIFFFFFLLTSFAVGVVVEIIGVNTGLLFGSYVYGTVLGPKIYGVPWLIGVNWFVMVYGSGVIMHRMHEWINTRFGASDIGMSKKIILFSFIIDGGLLTVLFDWVMEPVAIKLGFWQWEGGVIPFFNYVCWFLISSLLLLLFKRLDFQKDNHFSIHLFIIQLLFFIILRLYL
nr:carotenoid biosynthesis protein [uncultured Sediminibacterium sp.]